MPAETRESLGGCAVPGVAAVGDALGIPLESPLRQPPPPRRATMIRSIVVSAAYVAAQMLADVTSLKVVRFLGMSMDAGTFVYAITFTLRDVGRRRGRCCGGRTGPG